MDVSDKNMDFTVKMDFKQSWNDPRLSFEDGEGVVKEIGVGAEFAKNFWVPDTFFANEKKATIPGHLADSDMFLQLQSSGKILLSRRLTVTASCEMDLHEFPLDYQVCGLEIESFGHSVQDIELGWMDGNDSVRMFSADMPNNLFTVEQITLREKKFKLISGICKTLVMDMKMRRRWGYFVKTFYIPVGVSVIMSWLAFFISPRHVTARVILGLGMLFSAMLLQIQAVGMTASVSHMTAADLYGGGCCMLIIMSLVVSVVASCTKSEDKKNRKLQETEGIVKSKFIKQEMSFRIIILLFRNIEVSSSTVD